MPERRVVITGMGLVTPYGFGVDTLWNGLMERRSAVRPIEGIDIDTMRTTHYAQIPAFDWDDYLDPKQTALWGRVSKMTVVGGKLAREHAGIEQFDPPRTGVILGTGYAEIPSLESVYDTYFNRGWKKGKPITIPMSMPNAPASHLAIYLGARGVNFTVSTACSSGAIAAGLALQQIRLGNIDTCVTGAVDFVINRSCVAAWNQLRVLSRRNDPTASRPFSVDRDGLVMGEACSLIVLEEMEAARARGATIYAELAGTGATADAKNIVGPDMQGEIEAMHLAFADSGIGPEDVDYISAHGTSTKANDANETKVIKEIFGKRAYEIPVSSIKGHIGHAMGAAGAIEINTTALALYHKRVPPTLHYTPGDPDCDLDYVADGPRDVDMECAVTNSFGFGGQNSVLVLKKA